MKWDEMKWNESNEVSWARGERQGDDMEKGSEMKRGRNLWDGDTTRGTRDSRVARAGR